jgi:hypothetical protein
MNTIEDEFRKALVKLEKQMNGDGPVNTSDVKNLALWQEMLRMEHEAKRIAQARFVSEDRFLPHRS